MTETRQGNTHIYQDLGYADADEMLIKAQLVTTIRQTIQAQHWTQQQAAEVLEISQPKLSDLLKGRFRGVSEAKLLECLAKLHYRVQIAPSFPPQCDTHSRDTC